MRDNIIEELKVNHVLYENVGMKQINYSCWEHMKHVL